MNIVCEIQEAIIALSSEERKRFCPHFFKTGKGEYGEGDLFLGTAVPDQRKIAGEYWSRISFPELQKLLSSEYHECRNTALLMPILKFEKSKSAQEKKDIAHFYLENRKYINNWDLVDVSCYKILGRYVYENNCSEILTPLAESENLWENRIAVVSTMYHVRKGEFGLMKRTVLKNLGHPHDLMHKANGWLLREMGKKDEKALTDFLNLYAKEMPRTTLRYAIERLDETMRMMYLSK